MARSLMLFFFLLSCFFANAQIKALTENGKEVILFADKTWKYSVDSLNKTGEEEDSIAMSNAVFTKSKNSAFLVKSTRFNVGIYIDPAKWTFAAHKENEVNPEFKFESKTSDVAGLMITEKFGIELDKMKNIALINAQNAAPDARIVNSEYRMVNSKKVLCLNLVATLQGIKFEYMAYYFSNSRGTCQLLVYTAFQEFAKVKPEIESFLNGIVEVQN